MDFGALPPEVNSARMYAGAGSAPLTSAASAWSRLAAEFNAAATAYDRVATRLASDDWTGPASASMANAASSYVTWLNSAAADAEQAASHARAAASAYETAFAATVPPSLIAENRSRLASLVASNVVGQNTPAIAAAEAQYGEMWAQDAAAMYSYAAHSAVASKVTPFTSPQQTTSPAGQAAQAAAVTQATSSAGQSQTSRLISSIPNALQSLASPTSSSTSSATSSTSGLDEILSNLYSAFGLKYTAGAPIANLLAPWTTYVGPVQSSFAIPHFATGFINSSVALSKALAPATAAAKAVGDGAKAAAGLPAAAGPLGGLLGGGAPISASLGNAASAGRLSVPSTWAGPRPALTPASPLPINSISAEPEVGSAGNLLGGMPLAGIGADTAGRGPRYGFRPTVMARPPFAG